MYKISCTILFSALLSNKMQGAEQFFGPFDQLLWGTSREPVSNLLPLPDLNREQRVNQDLALRRLVFSVDDIDHAWLNYVQKHYPSIEILVIKNLQVSTV